MNEHKKLEYFDYGLPKDMIAQTPLTPRDASKLLVALDDSGVDNIVDQHFSDIEQHFKAGDVLVINETKVMKARLNLFRETGGGVEVLLLEPTGEHMRWYGLVKPSKKCPVGTKLYRGKEYEAESILVLDDLGEGKRIIEIIEEGVLETSASLPLPPYIKETLEDESRYQTVYAKDTKSVAAPTAGLHFTKELLTSLEKKGVEILKVNLIVGIGTFRPITTESISQHTMHSETYNIDTTVWEAILHAKDEGRTITAVGTTVVRTLESAATTQKLSGETELFISRGYEFKIIERLITNFHVPKSSLLVMIDALIGERWKYIYSHALNNDYRFLSLGDAMLIKNLKLNE